MDKREWDLWAKEFHNAKRFFLSKGNVMTRNRLKKQWHEDFVEMIKEN